jgi:hypothetical protein
MVIDMIVTQTSLLKKEKVQAKIDLFLPKSKMKFHTTHDFLKYEFAPMIQNHIIDYFEDFDKRKKSVLIMSCFAGSGKTRVTTDEMCYYIDNFGLCFTYFSSQVENLEKVVERSNGRFIYLKNKMSYCHNNRAKELYKKYGDTFDSCENCHLKDVCEYKEITYDILNNRNSNFCVTHRNYECFYEIFDNKNNYNENRILVFDEDFSNQFMENFKIFDEYETEILKYINHKHIRKFFKLIHINFNDAINYFYDNLNEEKLRNFKNEYDAVILEKYDGGNVLKYRNPFSFFIKYWIFLNKMKLYNLDTSVTCRNSTLKNEKDTIVFECYNQIKESDNLLLLNATFNEKYLKLLFKKHPNEFVHNIINIEKNFTKDTKIYSIYKYHPKDEYDSTYPISSLRVWENDKWILSKRGLMCCNLIRKFIEDKEVINHTNFSKYNSALVICKLDLVELIKAELGSQFEVDHFNGVRGKNEYENLKICVILGTLYESDDVRTIDDEFGISRLQKRKDEIIQCIHRVRGLVKGNKRAILLFTSILNEELKNSVDFTIFNPHRNDFKDVKKINKNKTYNKIVNIIEMSETKILKSGTLFYNLMHNTKCERYNIIESLKQLIEEKRISIDTLDNDLLFSKITIL